MDLFEVDLVSGDPVSLILLQKVDDIAYSSSMVSCVGNGSSKPRLIISMVRLGSTPNPISTFPLKLKSSGAWGELPAKRQRSIPGLLDIPSAGSVTPKFGVPAGR